MNIAIMQPTFNPWLGYFDLINSVDTFVFLDSVQLARRSWQVRNRIKCQDKALMLTIPISKNVHRDEQMINTASIIDSAWREKALKSIQTCYGKAPFYPEVFPMVESLFLFDSMNLAEFNIHFITTVAQQIGITTQFKCSSQLSMAEGKKETLLLNICEELGAHSYTSPKGAYSYLNTDNSNESFARYGITLYYHSYTHPIYPQSDTNFLSHIGIIDLLFNCGLENALKIATSGHGELISHSHYSMLQQDSP